MPYVRSNWEGLTAFNGGGKFEAGHAHSLTEVKLHRPGASGPRGCFLHGAYSALCRCVYLGVLFAWPVSVAGLEVDRSGQFGKSAHTNSVDSY